VAVGAAFALAVRVVRDGTRRPNVAMAAIGALAGLAVLCDYEAALGASFVVVYAFARSARRLPSGIALALGAAPFALLLLAIHFVCFGSPWITGYSFSPHSAHREGWLGLVGPNGPALWEVLLAPDNGLLVFSPWVVLSIAGAVAIARDAEARSRIGVEAAVAAAIVVGYVLVVGSLVPSFARGGWSVGPRYVAVAVPFAAWLAAAGLASLDGSLVARTLAHALVLVGVIAHVLAASTYPHWPDMFVNPLHEISVRALREGLAPHSLGTMAGLSGLRSLLPLYAVVAGLCVALLDGARGRRWIALPAAAGLAVLVVFVVYVRFPASGPETEEVWGFVRRTWEPLP
jgi:hypothetical protein